MTKFSLYLLKHLPILLLLHQFVDLPQHHQPDQIIPNHHWHIAPPSQFGLLFFDIFGLHVVLQYKFFHFVEQCQQSLVIFHHQRYQDFQSTFRNWRPDYLTDLLNDTQTKQPTD